VISAHESAGFTLTSKRPSPSAHLQRAGLIIMLFALSVWGALWMRPRLRLPADFSSAASPPVQGRKRVHSAQVTAGFELPGSGISSSSHTFPACRECPCFPSGRRARFRGPGPYVHPPKLIPCRSFQHALITPRSIKSPSREIPRRRRCRFGLAEWRRHFVLHHFCTRPRTNHLVAFLIA